MHGCCVFPPAIHKTWLHLAKQRLWLGTGHFKELQCKPAYLYESIAGAFIELLIMLFVCVPFPADFFIVIMSAHFLHCPTISRGLMELKSAWEATASMQFNVQSERKSKQDKKR